MPGSWARDALPYLPDDHWACTSKATRSYNCIAWAAGDNTRRWDPFVYYWPPGVPKSMAFDALVALFSGLNYTLCPDGSLDEKLQKVALFGKAGAFGIEWTHAALQLPNGRWTSKIGDCEDIAHEALEAINCPDYGTPLAFMSRPKPW
jgi:hypothetical protein